MASLDEIGLDLSGVTPFFSAAWNACRSIPPGETRSYAWLAAEAGSPLAMRAAGQAMARNRFSLIIPCHRVIASDGGLGGYGGGGLGVKARLLQMELVAKE
jgi:O-6-methylguanine DNA methyltransferase